MFHNSSAQEIAGQFLKDFNDLVRRQAILETVLTEVKEKIRRIETDITGIKQVQSEGQQLRTDLASFRKSMNALQWEFNDMKATIEKLDPQVIEIKHWIDSEEERRQASDADFRAVKVEVIKWVVVSVLTALVGMFMVGYWALHQEKTAPPPSLPGSATM
jgi:chromosome segregation ATPase